MKLGLNEFSASDVVNKLGAKELEKFLNFSAMKKMQKNFFKDCEKDRNKKIDNKDLVEIIEKNKKKKISKHTVLQKIFQSLKFL